MSTVCVILPALNEADAIPAALKNRPEGARVIVVDNGSTDATAEIARAHGVDVIIEPRRGFGAACKAGLDASEGSEVIVYMDADDTCDWADLPLLVDPILAGHKDMVLGRRAPQLREKGSMPFHVGIAVMVLGLACGRLAGTSVHDVPPFRAIRRSSLVALDLQDRTFGWPLEMVIRGGHAGLRIAEVDVHYRVRVGVSKVTGTFSGTLKAMWKMTGVLWRYRNA